MESVFGCQLRDTHLDDLVQKVPVKVWLSEFLSSSLFGDQLFSSLGLALVTLEPFEVDWFFEGYLKFNLKLFWDPVVVDKAL